MIDVFIDASFNRTTKIGSMGIYFKDKPELSLSKCFVCLDSNKSEEYCLLYLLSLNIDENIRIFTDNRLVYDKYKNKKMNNVFEIIWIPRYLNSEADKLASMARKNLENLLVEYNDLSFNNTKEVVKTNNKNNNNKNIKYYNIKDKKILLNKLNELINNNKLILNNKRKNKILLSLNNQNFDILNYDFDLKIYFLKLLKNSNLINSFNYKKEDVLLNIFLNLFSTKYLKKILSLNDIKKENLKILTHKELKNLLQVIIKN